MSKETLFVVGDIVCHKTAFLRSLQWFTDVPKNGVVQAVDQDRTSPILTVLWQGRDQPTRILAVNVCLYANRHLQPA